MATVAPASSTKISPVGFTDLSKTDMAKITLIKTAKVAIVVLAAAAVATAVWFLAPIAIPAGMFIFGGSMAGLAGGGAILTTIEALAFKWLNGLEDNIYNKYVKLKIDLKNEIEEQTSKEFNELKAKYLEQSEAEVIRNFSYGEFKKDSTRGFIILLDGKKAESGEEITAFANPDPVSSDAINDTEKLLLASSRQLIESTLQSVIFTQELESSLLHVLFNEKDKDASLFIGTVLVQENNEQGKLVQEGKTDTNISHDSTKRKTTITTYVQVVRPDKWTPVPGKKNQVTKIPGAKLGYLKIESFINWDNKKSEILATIVKEEELPLRKHEISGS